jgi:hypothetical protein
MSKTQNTITEPERKKITDRIQALKKQVAIKTAELKYLQAYLAKMGTSADARRRPLRLQER